MRIIKIIAKAIDRLYLKMIKSLLHIDVKAYMKRIVKYYRKKGMDIPQMPRYIYNDTYFDPKDYSIIQIGEGCTISRKVMFLTHDYSMHTVYNDGKDFSLKEDKKISERDKMDSLLVLKPIYLGDNVFVGARASLLPGTHIGNNSIVAAGAVVKGEYPPGSIIVGNPAKNIANVPEWLDKKFDTQ